MTAPAGTWADDLALALALGEAAAAVSLRELDQPLRVDTKSDSTPVTNVDHAVDRMLTAALLGERPDDAILSEESGEHGRAVRRLAVWQEPDMNDILGVAEGRHDAVVGSPGEIWDHAPNLLLVEEAGGRFRDHRGGHRIDIGSAHYTNGAIDLAPVIDP